MSKKKKSTIAKASPLKVILPVICGLVIVVAVAIIIMVATAPAKSAKVSNPNSAYVTIGNYKITKQEMYEALKSGSGLTTLQEIIDKELIAKNVTYTEAEYEEAKEYVLYGDPSTYKDLSEEEAAEKRENMKKDYLTSLSLMGYMNETDRDAYVDLQVKRYLYAYKAYLADSTSRVISDDDLKAKFKGDEAVYEDSFMGIIITFENEDQLKAYLELAGVDSSTYKTSWNRLADIKANSAINEEIKALQDANGVLEEEINDLEASLADVDESEVASIEQQIEIKRGEVEDNLATIEAKTANLKSSEEMKLTKKEIQLVFVKLYNLVNAYYNGATGQFNEEGLVAGSELIKEDVHYGIAEDEVVFNLEALKALEEDNKFHQE